MSLLAWALRPACLGSQASRAIRPNRVLAVPAHPARIPLSLVTRRRSDAPTPASVENTNVSHAGFISKASPQSKWGVKDQDHDGKPDVEEEGDDVFDNIAPGRGKLSPTSSHLFKLIIPLGHLTGQLAAGRSTSASPAPPTVFLLHPTQPLSHVARLIAASLAPAEPTIAFRSKTRKGNNYQWSDATDVGDFVRDAAQATEFSIHIARGSPAPGTPVRQDAQDGADEAQIRVDVPTFVDRTRFLRRRLEVVGREMQEMEGLKKLCDREAHRGARRLALGGFGVLVTYWGTVARLTFWDLGWDIMEPVTYLSGLSMVICGYLWFLYQGREVSYTSVLNRSISTRRATLYEQRGFDIERWEELVGEARQVRREIAKIAEDYDHWKGDPRTEAALKDGGAGADDGLEGAPRGFTDDPDNVEGGPGESDGEKVKRDAKRSVGEALTGKD